MKAIQVKEFGGPEVLQIAEIPEPIPAAQEVRVTLHVAGVNPNEAYVRTGTYGAYIPELPYTPGFDGAGIVDAVGTDVTDLKVGDRVFIGGFLAERNTGTYAEKVVVDAYTVHPLPENLTFEQGASLGIPALAAYQAVVLRANVSEHDTVMIHGASGAVGLLAVQMAKSLGAKVIGTSSTEAGRELILQHGADDAIPHVKMDEFDAVLTATDDRGPDVIIEMLADQNLETDLTIVNRFGRIVIVGSRGKVEIDPRHTMTKEVDIYGMSAVNIDQELYTASFQAISEMLVDGVLAPLVGERLPLTQAQEAHEHILSKKGNGKLVLTILD